jgi:nitroreductase
MEVIEAIDSRVTAMRLSEPGPSRGELTRIITSGVQAPDHGRLRPWRFIILEGESRSRLGDAMADILRRKSPSATTEQLQAQRAKATRSPVIIVVAAAIRHEGAIPPIEQALAVGACVQNMLLTAHSLGYGSAWKTGEAAYDHGVKSCLGLEKDDQIIAFVYIGKQLHGAPSRLNEIDSVLRWQQGP